MQQPQPIQNLFADSLQAANKTATNRHRKQFKPEFARFKLKFYYRDGKQSIHYSYDFYHQHIDGVKRRVTDQALGLTKLMRLIEKNRQADTFTSAIIWCKLSADISTSVDNYNFEVVRCIRNGTAKVCKHLRFDHGVLEWEMLTRISDRDKYNGLNPDREPVHESYHRQR